jgi:hypothetical protein
MKFRKLQRLNEKQQWEDHGYAYERDDGRASFRYNNLVLGRIGARYNVQLRETKTKLEDVPQVIPATKRLRWLGIEEIDGDPEDIKAELDEACKIPRLQRVSVVKPIVA